MNNTINEEVKLWSGRPSHWYYTPQYIFAALFGGCFIAASVLFTLWYMLGILLSLLIAALFWFRLNSVGFELTTNHMYVYRGVLTQKITDVDLSKVDSIESSKGFLSRIVGIGSVYFRSGSSKVKVFGIREFEEVKQLANSSRLLKLLKESPIHDKDAF